jgi:hypothetical protein
MQEGPKTLPKDFPPELSYAENKAQTDFQQKAIEQGARPKSREYPNPQLTNEERIAGFKAAIEGKSTAAPTADKNAPTSISSPEDAAKLGPEYKVGDKPTGIKAVASADNKNYSIKPNTGIAPNIGGIRGPSSADAPFGLEAPVNPDANKTIAQIAAEKEAYMGPNVAAQQDRARLMAERVDAKEEARRNTSMRMAEFFAAWGSTPGSTIVAGLNTLRNKIPDFISDQKEETKIRRAIDKDIVELEKIDRLEKAGNYDKAAERKAALSKESLETWGKKVTAASNKYTADSSVQAAGIRAAVAAGNKENVNSGKDRRFYETEISKLDAKQKELTAGKGSDYIQNKNIITNAKTKIEKGDASPALKARYEAAVTQNAKIDNDYKTRKAELTAELNRFSGNKSDTPADTTTTLPEGAIPGSKQVGTSKGVPVYESPDGKRYTLK